MKQPKVKSKELKTPLHRSLALDAASLTEASALACFDWIGKGKEKDADKAAVTAMRKRFNEIEIDGTVVIGEGERDSAPMLFIGEKVGKGGRKIDIAIDPLEGTTICAQNMPNSISVLAFSADGGLLNAPDVYMDKIAIGAGYQEGIIDLDNSVATNIKNFAKAKKASIFDVMVCVLNRPRHQELISKIREAGAKVQLITDGDVTGVIATSMPNTNIDMYMGMGGAPEGVLAAAALKCIGGQLNARLIFRNEDEKGRAYKTGIKDLNRQYTLNDLATGDIIFAATGVTDGWFLQGVKRYEDRYSTSSIVMHSSVGRVDYIDSTFVI